MHRSFVYVLLLSLSVFFNIVLVRKIILLGFEKKRLASILLKFKDLSSRFRDVVIQREEVFLKTVLSLSKNFIDDVKNAYLVYFQGEKGKVIALEERSTGNEVFVRKEEFSYIPERVHVISGQDSIKVLSKLQPNVIHQLGPTETSDSWSKYLAVSDIQVGGELKAKLFLARERSFDQEEIELLKSLSSLITSFVATHNYVSAQGRFQKDMILTMIRILEYHDKYTKGHSKNVATIASLLAERLGLSDEMIKKAYWASLLHDIGKIVIPSQILNKEGKLTIEEFEVIKRHPVYGHDFLTTSEDLKELAKYVLHHHERWDGKGYPMGLSGDDIPLISRIIAVADAYDAMRSDRPYRKGLPIDVIRNEIVEHSGMQFDPEIAKLFVKMIDSGEIRN